MTEPHAGRLQRRASRSASPSSSFRQITFDLRKLLNKVTPPYRRQVDMWAPDKGEIWDLKHHLGKVPTAQADDYRNLIRKIAPDGKPVVAVNYLFPTRAAAMANAHLAPAYRFGVYFVDPVTRKMVRLF